jgi:hypothetical protein
MHIILPNLNSSLRKKESLPKVHFSTMSLIVQCNLSWLPCKPGTYIDTPGASQIPTAAIPAFMTLLMYHLGQTMILAQLWSCLLEMASWEGFREVIATACRKIESVEPRENFFQRTLFQSFNTMKIYLEIFRKKRIYLPALLVRFLLLLTIHSFTRTPTVIKSTSVLELSKHSPVIDFSWRAWNSLLPTRVYRHATSRSLSYSDCTTTHTVYWLLVYSTACASRRPHVCMHSRMRMEYSIQNRECMCWPRQINSK